MRNNHNENKGFRYGFGAALGYCLGGLAVTGLAVGGLCLYDAVKKKFDSGEWSLRRKKS